MADVIAGYDEQIDVALHKALQCRRSGLGEAETLTETVIAVQTAKALQTLTGIGWEQHLAGRAGSVAELDEDNQYHQYPRPGPAA